MKIIKLTQSSRKEDRAVIYMDNGEVFSIHKDLVLNKQLWVGKEVSNEIVEEIQKADLFYKLFDKAMRKVSGRPQSEKEIRQSLNTYIFKNKLEVEENVIEKVINKLRTYDFINDERYAQYFIQTKSRSKSIFEIKQLLKMRGVPEAITEKYIGSEEKDKEDDIILKLTEKKLRTLLSKKLPRKELQTKLLNFLYRKGFPFDKSRNIVDNILQNI